MITLDITCIESKIKQYSLYIAVSDGILNDLFQSMCRWCSVEFRLDEMRVSAGLNSTANKMQCKCI